jgi:NodT family efflux transporter outer membrane factor (OMF) lipoprotein
MIKNIKGFHMPALVVLMLMLLGGCAGYKGISTSSNINDALELPGISSEKGIWPDEKWWEKYNDSQLNRLVEETLNNNPTLGEAQARIREARAAAGIVDSDRFIQVNLGAESMFQRFTGNGSVSPEFAEKTDTVNSLKLNAAYEFDLWGKNKADYAAAMGMVKVAEIDAETARLALAAEVVQSYLHLDLVCRQEAISVEILGISERLTELRSKRYAAGLDSEQRVKYSQRDSAAVKADIRALQETQALLKNKLGALTGKGPAASVDIHAPAVSYDKGFSLPAFLPVELIARRPDIAAQKWRIEAMEKRIESAKTDFYPNLNLNAFAGFDSIGLENLLNRGSGVFGIGPAITLPLFNGGRLKSSLAARNAEYDTAVERYNTLIINAVQEIADSIASWKSAESRISEYENITEKLAEIKKLAEINYKGGLSSNIPVLEAESGLLAEMLFMENIKIQKANAGVALITALGGGLTPAVPSENK